MNVSVMKIILTSLAIQPLATMCCQMKVMLALVMESVSLMIHVSAMKDIWETIAKYQFASIKHLMIRKFVVVMENAFLMIIVLVTNIGCLIIVAIFLNGFALVFQT